MFKTMIATLSLTGAVVAGVAATPAMAQDGSYRYSESYRGPDGSYSRTEERRDGYDGYQRGYRGDYDGAAYRDGYRDDGYRDGGYRGDSYGYRDRPVEYRGNSGYRYGSRQRCSSGTTGTIVGGVLGGLLGREIGRGGRWNQPSTTGLILGAGAGALAGRAVERDGCR
jgi:hypothetical protein